MRKVAIITHDFSEFGGSTVVAMEIANYFSALGDMVTIRAERFSNTLKPYLGVNVTISERRIDIFDYDLVWSQHGHFSLNTKDLTNINNWKGTFISAHLSSSTPAEVYHYPFASRYAGAVIFNAGRVEDELLARHKPRGYWLNIKNAAPDIFHRRPEDNKFPLRSILIVSNHAPKEVLEAMDMLRNEGIICTHVGIGGDRMLIQPEEIHASDAVISIGKTVQYALVGGRPVYCYDHFGGPGWINLSNFELAENRNYSGRCTGITKTAIEIRDEVLNGFTGARDFAVSHWEYFHKSYNLEVLMDKILSEIARRGTANFFYEERCLEEIDAMRGALVHVDWIWRDVFGRHNK